MHTFYVRHYPATYEGVRTWMGSIALKDGRWLVIASDHAALQRIEALFPLDINGEPVAIADHIALMAELRVEQIMREQREQK